MPAFWASDRMFCCCWCIIPFSNKELCPRAVLVQKHTQMCKLIDGFYDAPAPTTDFSVFKLPACSATDALLFSQHKQPRQATPRQKQTTVCFCTTKALPTQSMLPAQHN